MRKTVPKSIQNELRKRSKGYCENCREVNFDNKGITPDIHHRDKDNSNNELNNLLLVCPNCHRKLTHKQQVKEQKEKKEDKGIDIGGGWVLDPKL